MGLKIGPGRGTICRGNCPLKVGKRASALRLASRTYCIACRQSRAVEFDGTGIAWFINRESIRARNGSLSLFASSIALHP